MASRWARVMRGTIAAIVATLVAATSHALAGGTVTPVALAVALTFATLVSIALTGKRLSVVKLAASVVLSQLAFHLLFSLIGEGGTIVTHGHHSMVVTTDGAAASASLPSSMWIGHAIAAVITIAALRFGERAFWRLGDLLFVRTIVRFALQPIRVARPVATGLVWVPRVFQLHSSSLRYRGPPVASVA